jgi:hypothetical protein
MVLLDSRCSKNSNGISFVIFGLTDDFLLILQVAAKHKGIWFCLFSSRPRGAIGLAGTASFGSELRPLD